MLASVYAPCSITRGTHVTAQALIIYKQANENVRLLIMNPIIITIIIPIALKVDLTKVRQQQYSHSPVEETETGHTLAEASVEKVHRILKLSGTWPSQAIQF